MEMYKLCDAATTEIKTTSTSAAASKQASRKLNEE